MLSNQNPPAMMVEVKPQPTYILPKVYIANSAVYEMTREVLSNPGRETGWGLYGIIAKDRLTVYIVGVIRPAVADITRHYAATTLGGERLADSVRWLMANVELNKKNGINIDGDFAFLYKGHSHHQLGYGQYSPTDKDSIKESVIKEGLELAIGPLATIDQTEMKIINRFGGDISVNNSAKVKFTFYYYDRYMYEAGVVEPVVIKPTVLNARAVPALPPLGWQFASDSDYMEQLRHLRAYGCNVKTSYRDTDNKPPFEIIFTVTRNDWKGILVIETAWDFPRTLPKFKVVPNIPNKDSVCSLRYKGLEHLLEGPIWNRDEDFIEAIFRLEARGEL